MVGPQHKQIRRLVGVWPSFKSILTILKPTAKEIVILIDSDDAETDSQRNRISTAK